MKGKLEILDDTKACSSHASENVIFNVPERMGAGKFRGRAAVITLGCAKNRVDSEVMLGSLHKSGYEIVTDASQAEVIVVNTCGFLESSVKESVDRILEASDLKETGRCKQLLVAGCMVERYKSELLESLPEVDKFLSVDELLNVADIADGKLEPILERAARPYFLYDDTMPRFLSTVSHSAYVKIAEGCNRPCTFCIIPKLRGAMRSRVLDSVVREVEELGARGVKEVNLIAQDLTSYGLDRDKDGANLADLLRALNKTEAVSWIRLLYAYPIGTDDALLDAILELPRVTEYLDIPLQHCSERILKEMKRPLGRFSPRALTEKIRIGWPDIHLRTTFICGFPGETEQDVRELETFIRAGHFTNLGVFKYSAEIGTPAGAIKEQISSAEKEERYGRLMLAQQEVLEEKLKGFIGKSYEVVLEGTHADTDLLLSARTRFQAPEIDGTVIINDIEEGAEVTPGTIGVVEVTEVAGYDLVGKLKRCTHE